MGVAIWRVCLRCIVMIGLPREWVAVLVVAVGGNVSGGCRIIV